MKIFFVLFLFLSSITHVHEYYIGLTEIKHNKGNKSIEISIKLFTDDLNKAISETNNTLIHLNTEKEVENSTVLINNYLKKHFHITINNKEIEYTFLGKEYEDDACWLYLEATKIRRIKNIEIENELLFDTYKSQKHLTNIIINDKTVSSIIDYRNPTFTYRVKK